MGSETPTTPKRFNSPLTQNKFRVKKSVHNVKTKRYEENQLIGLRFLMVEPPLPARLYTQGARYKNSPKEPRAEVWLRQRELSNKQFNKCFFSSQSS